MATATTSATESNLKPTLKSKTRTESEQKRRERVLSGACIVSRDNLHNTISKAHKTLQKSIVDVQTELTDMTDLYEATKSALELAKKDLVELHKIEIGADTLAKLELSQNNAKAEYENVMTRLEADHKVAAARQAEELKRTADVAQYEQAMLHRRREDEFNLRLDAAKRVIEEREKNLRTQEEELKKLREMAAKFDETVNRIATERTAIEVKKATETLAVDHKIALAAKDNINALSAAQLTSLKQVVERLEKQVAALEAQLVTAHKQAAEVATSAFGSLGSKATLDVLMQSRTPEATTGTPSRRS